MDLLNENQYKKPESSKGKKIVITLLIISILLAIIIVSVMIYLASNQEIPLTVYINGQVQQETNELIFTDANNNKYISLKKLSEILGYKYYNSVYQIAGEETDKCYIENDGLISGFESDSNKIYKYEENTNLDYQYYELKHNVIIYNNKLYIALEDLQLALNIGLEFDSGNNTIALNSMEYLAESYQEKLKESGYIVVTDKNNQKALAYGWIIVSKNNIWGVLDTNFEEKVGSRYSSIYFDEKNSNYIVSDSAGRYGIITNEGLPKQSLMYEGLEIINYEYMLYKVKNNNKYGIIKEDGTMLTDIIYDEIGYQPDRVNKVLYTLVIPEIYEDIGKTVVVKQNDKYGLIYLETGEIFLPCDHLERLYSIYDMGKVQYRVEFTVDRQTVILELAEYLKERQTQEANLN